VTLFERASHSPAPTTPSLTVAASPDQLKVVRAFVRTVTAHHALSVDALTDLVLAVDEAAGILLDHTLPSSILTCTFDIDPGHLRVILAATTTAPIDTSTTSFRWFVLQTLVDRLVLEQFPSTVAGAPRNSTATIILAKVLQADA
jgi:serine/threonine-protein kinase RsbW